MGPEFYGPCCFPQPMFGTLAIQCRPRSAGLSIFGPLAIYLGRSGIAVLSNHLPLLRNAHLMRIDPVLSSGLLYSTLEDSSGDRRPFDCDDMVEDQRHAGQLQYLSIAHLFPGAR